MARLALAARPIVAMRSCWTCADIHENSVQSAEAPIKSLAPCKFRFPLTEAQYTKAAFADLESRAHPGCDSAMISRFPHIRSAKPNGGRTCASRMALALALVTGDASLSGRCICDVLRCLAKPLVSRRTASVHQKTHFELTNAFLHHYHRFLL